MSTKDLLSILNELSRMFAPIAFLTDTDSSFILSVTSKQVSFFSSFLISHQAWNIVIQLAA